MYDIPFDRKFLLLSNGIRHVMPSTDRKLELKAKASMAQPVSQPALCCNGLTCVFGVNCLQLQVLDCLNCEGGGSHLKRNLILIFRSSCNDIEEILLFCNFVENTLEYYRILLLLIILKGMFSPSNLRALM